MNAEVRNKVDEIVCVGELIVVSKFNCCILFMKKGFVLYLVGYKELYLPIGIFRDYLSIVKLGVHFTCIQTLLNKIPY